MKIDSIQVTGVRHFQPETVTIEVSYSQMMDELERMICRAYNLIPGSFADGKGQLVVEEENLTSHRFNYNRVVNSSPSDKQKEVLNALKDFRLLMENSLKEIDMKVSR